MNNIKINIKIIILMSFLVMIIVNGLANIIPINGITTGEVSDSYENLFAPAGLTFSIWGVIYILLALYSLYQLLRGDSAIFMDNAEKFKTIGIFFSISSIMNAVWILAWHYNNIPITMILMTIILICLILINLLLKNIRMTTIEYIILKLPFSVYFGWITVATIANATTLLVYLEWGGYGFSEVFWTVSVIFAGAFIAIATVILNNDAAYGIVVIWAYTGILIKHISEDYFAGEYKIISMAVVISMALLIATEGNLIFLKKSKPGRGRI